MRSNLTKPSDPIFSLTRTDTAQAAACLFKGYRFARGHFNVPSGLGESAVEGAHFVGTIARSYVTLDAEVFRAEMTEGTEAARRKPLRRPAKYRNCRASDNKPRRTILLRSIEVFFRIGAA
jgi:hypothetical protein